MFDSTDHDFVAPTLYSFQKVAHEEKRLDPPVIDVHWNMSVQVTIAI